MSVCFYCGRSLINRPASGVTVDATLTRDHIFPASMVLQLTPEQRAKLPPSFSTENVVKACHSCNSMKGRLHPLDWLVIMPNNYNAARLAERMVNMGCPLGDVFDALRRRKR